MCEIVRIRRTVGWPRAPFTPIFNHPPTRPTVTDALPLASALADRYRLEREVGQGGMATVYLAHDIRHDRKVALKVLRPELSAILGAQRFLAEIKTTANLQHPHILGLFDSGEAGGLVFYVMPFVEGESLRARLVREKQLPVEDAVRIAREVADALDYAHRHGVIHRDIKPENILLHDGRALVADFGIALAAARSDGGSRMTETGMSLGTPHYMSPEQAMGEREITARSDVYALGCVLYEMLTGEPPFTGPTAQAIFARVMTEEPRSLTLQRKTVPPHVEAAVLTALSKLPADRFSTAAQFGEALSRPGLATVPITTARAAAARPTRRVRALVLAPWIVALLAVGAAVWSWRGRPGQLGTSWQYIQLGDGFTPRLLTPSLALSPDGTSLVIRESPQNGRLWLKRRGELHAQPIPGTEGAAFPAFSPDGQWVTFINDNRLMKTRPGQGGVSTVTDSVNAPFGGAAWLDDGSLVYVGPAAHELSRVSASGGPRTRLLLDSAMAGYGIGNASRAARRPGRPVHAVQLGLRVHADPRARPRHRPRAPAAGRRRVGLLPPDRPPALRAARRRRHGRAVRPARSQDHRSRGPGARERATGHGRCLPGVVPVGRADLRAGERRASSSRSCGSHGPAPRR